MSDIADKIKKLIDKANGTDNPNEAAIFMNKATELMAAHGLSMEAIDLSAIKEAEVKSRFSVSKPKDYELTLMHGIARSFGCELLWRASYSWNRGDNYAAVIFVGPKDRLELATYAAEVLGRQLAKARQVFSNKQSQSYWKIAADAGNYDSIEQCKSWEDGQLKQMIRDRVTKEANSFAMGWAMEIQRKVTKFALNDKEQALLATYVGQQSNGETVENQKTELSAASMMLGREAARDAHLHRPMGDHSEAVSLLGQTLKLGGS